MKFKNRQITVGVLTIIILSRTVQLLLVFHIILQFSCVSLIENALLVLVQVCWQGTHLLLLVEALLDGVLGLFDLLAAQGVVVDRSLSYLRVRDHLLHLLGTLRSFKSSYWPDNFPFLPVYLIAQIQVDGRGLVDRPAVRPSDLDLPPNVDLVLLPILLCLALRVCLLSQVKHTSGFLGARHLGRLRLVDGAA